MRRAARATATAARRSSHAPVLTLPACRHTIVGPGAAREASARARSPTSIAPFGVGRPPARRRASPRPSSRSGAVDRRVPLGAGDDPHARARRAGRRARRPSPRRRSTWCRGRRRARRCWPPGAPVTNPTDARRREAEQLLQPAAGDLLDRGRGRGERRVERALVPAGGEHVGGGRGVERSADHEPEVARARRRPSGRVPPRRRARRSPRPRPPARRAARRAPAGRLPVPRQA